MSAVFAHITNERGNWFWLSNSNIVKMGITKTKNCVPLTNFYDFAMSVARTDCIWILISKL